MKIPLSWIKEFVDVEASAQEMARCLTLQGLEVEALEKNNCAFSGVVVAKVLSVEPHPNADKLQIAKVFDGEAEYQVVCGAPNCRAGMKSAFARPGAEIGEGSNRFKIKKTKLRGIESSGMLCSYSELGLGGEESGIIDFELHMKEGDDLSELYADHIFEIGLTPNLSHCLSVRGVAREVAAAFSRPLKKREITSLPHGGKAPIEVAIINSDLCPMYKWIVIDSVSAKESPHWLKKRLEQVGIRPINLLVDITNFVMVEEGQPLHAFDLGKIQGKKIEVRASRKGDKITTLDGKERLLDEGVIVIADERGPIALAGIMGGALTEVDSSTTSILIESALFNERAIRKGSKKEQLYTEASRRFERGVDPNRVKEALIKAATLIAELSSESTLSSLGEAGLIAAAPKQIPLRISQINRLLGTQFSLGEVENLLRRLEFIPHFDGVDTFQVVVPTFRNDVTAEVDLIEEVARLFGYHNIQRERPLYHGSQEPSSPMYLFEREIKEKLVREGLQEFLSCDLLGPDLFEKIARGASVEKPIALLNPVSRDHSFLRNSLLAPLLEAVKINIDRECPDIAAFEVGRAHIKISDRYEEPTLLGIILSGKASPHDFSLDKQEDFSFRDMRGILENLFASLGLDKGVIHPASNPHLHPGRQATITISGLELGTFGEVHPAILRKFDIPRRILYAELSLDDLLKSRKQLPRFQLISSYPFITRDWTCILKEEAPVSQIEDALSSVPSKFLEKVFLYSLFRPKDKEGRKHVTFRFIYRDKEKTIEQSEADQEHARILDIVEELIASCLDKEHP